MSAVRRVVKKANDCRRFKAKISYNGELFSGWQKQGAQNGRSFRTIEQTLETCIGSALAQVLSAFCFERRLLFCQLLRYHANLRFAFALFQGVRFFPAGRTDAGVSAAGQCITFDAMLSPTSPMGAKPSKALRGDALTLARQRIFEEESQTVLLDVQGTPFPPPLLAAAFNQVLPADVRFLRVELAARNFDPLGETRWKRYSYSFDAAASTSLRKSLYWGTLCDAEQKGHETQDRCASAVSGGGRVRAVGAEDREVSTDNDSEAEGTEERPAAAKRQCLEPDEGSVPPLDVARMREAARHLVGCYE